MPAARPDPFWLRLRRHGSATALVDQQGQRALSYEDLADRVDRLAARLRRPHKRLVILLAEPDAETAIALLAIFASGNAAYLARSSLPDEALEALAEAYGAEALIGRTEHVCRLSPEASGLDLGDGYWLLERAPRGTMIHPELALALSTSGTTGSRKSVRLSYRNIDVSAAQAASALGFAADDAIALNLPLFHIYGHSLLCMALAQGARVVLERRTILSKDFWSTLRDQSATALFGVAYTFDTLRLLGLERMAAPSLRMMGHSGDFLSADAVAWGREAFERRGLRFHRMYGMTEASSRVCVLQPEDLADRPFSVGQAVAGGRLELTERSEVVYRGPNVMMGYATSAADLARGDETSGVLRTGDLGSLDSEGYLRLTGRLDRDVKILGHRLNLDEVQADLSVEAPVALKERDGRLIAFVEGPVRETLAARIKDWALSAGLPPHYVQFQQVEAIPRFESGKVNLAGLV